MNYLQVVQDFVRTPGGSEFNRHRQAFVHKATQFNIAEGRKVPITPLHFGLLPVLNRVSKVRPSAWAFILANCLIDFPVVLQIYSTKIAELGGPPMVGTLHSGSEHTLAGAAVVGLCVGALGFKSARWWLGGFLGGVTHILLDMFVHSDVLPFGPWYTQNPFYFDWAHGALSIALSIGLAFWVLDWWDARKVARRQKAEIGVTT